MVSLLLHTINSNTSGARKDSRCQEPTWGSYDIRELQNRTVRSTAGTFIAGSNKRNRTREQSAMRLGAEGGEGWGH